METWRLEGGPTRVYEGSAADDPLGEVRERKRAVKNALFVLLRDLTGICPPWGSLTGIRPTRLLYEAEAKGMPQSEGRKWLEDVFYVSPERTELLSEILDMQKDLYDCPNDEFDLYIGIPFCLTRCAYCSFSSGEIGNGKQVEPYLAALIREIGDMGAFLAEKGMRVRAAYMGGGTPTSLSAEQLDRVLKAANRAFPGAREWTVEAGRPDTIDREKLTALKNNGVGRISVNPQTFHDETLARIGRAHSSVQTVQAFRLARDMGFDDINMDLICALPGESREDFAESLSRTIGLGPESITVHTLAIKRSSRLHEKGYRQIDAGEAQAMVEYARFALRENGYAPYYLYRQKYMAGNLENVGLRQTGEGLPVQHRQYGGDHAHSGAGRRRNQQMAVSAAAAHRARGQREKHRTVHGTGGGNDLAQARADRVGGV